ncbi:Speckle-type POZ protein SPOP [Handroanthus impetiginosus]|uniref:Speckle-type POZ protein SPOP n=1 Tax=Handroanthus impetiginosus TaxID=429701 RepID=A0A2G9HPI3_9LAMI|nr:Speckle-type POZ protein SPOP [Handroanthus impetiginosus]
MEKGCHEFVIENYSRGKGMSVGERIDSSHFMVGGHKWVIIFYPRGQSEIAHKEGYTSVFLCLKSNIRSPLQISLEFSILDQSCRGNHLVFPFRYPYLESPLIRVSFRHSISGFRKFIKWSSLESSDYVKDDCLKISCTVEIFTARIENLSLANVWSGFSRISERKEGASVFLKVKGESIAVQKSKLVASSPAFRSLFSEAHSQEEIVIPDMEPTVFKAVLQFIYTGTFVEEEQDEIGDKNSCNAFLVKVLAAADQFDLKRLKKICESRIMECVSGESVAYLLCIADRYRATDLKAACLRFSAENQDVVMESNGSEYLKENCPLLYLDMVGSTNKLEVGCSHSQGKFSCDGTSKLTAFIAFILLKQVKYKPCKHHLLIHQIQAFLNITLNGASGFGEFESALLAYCPRLEIRP